MTDGIRDDDVDTGARTPELEGRPPPKEVLEVEYVYEALGHSRRRYLCYSLFEATQRSLSELATKIAAWENGISEQAVTEGQRQRVYLSLYHAHVPKLVDEGVIIYDDADETITPTERAEQVLAVIEGIGATLDSTRDIHARGTMDGGDRPWRTEQQ